MQNLGIKNLIYKKTLNIENWKKKLLKIQKLQIDMKKLKKFEVENLKFKKLKKIEKLKNWKIKGIIKRNDKTAIKVWTKIIKNFRN